MVLFAYLLLLVGWVIFLPVAVRGVGRVRRWAWGAVGAGVLGLVREMWMTFVWAPSVIAPIRLDIVLAGVFLAAVYGVAALQLWRGGHRRSGILAAGMVSLASVGTVAGWAAISEETARVAEAVREGHRLLFEAKFRNRSAYERYFSMAEAEMGYPSGHWSAEATGRHTRLVVNPSGRAFLFYRCDDMECQYAAGAPLEADGRGWRATLRMRGVGELGLTLEAPRDDAMRGTIAGVGAVFRRVPPPFLGSPDEERLTYLGAYSAVEDRGILSRVSQLWLWEDGEAALAVGVFADVVSGLRADFLDVSVLGRGEATERGWPFRWRRRGEAWQVLVQRSDGALRVAFPGREDAWPPRRLRPGALIRDDVVALAPRSGSDDWRHWFAVQLTGHFASADVPGPPPDRRGE